MSLDDAGIGEHLRETSLGHYTVVAALVITLQDNGVLPAGQFSDTLQRLWAEMPEEDAIGEAGAVIERVLDLLDARPPTRCPGDSVERKPSIVAIA